MAVAPQTGHFVAGSVEVGGGIRLKIPTCCVLCIDVTASEDYQPGASGGAAKGFELH
ncbi:MAG TPA: hypothetical protein VJV97_08640 [Gemmatimonadaceae bacterium]|nr:hypothetical protein [Gemmatimonadaceae bacterium]